MGLKDFTESLSRNINEGGNDDFYFYHVKAFYENLFEKIDAYKDNVKILAYLKENKNLNDREVSMLFFEPTKYLTM